MRFRDLLPILLLVAVPAIAGVDDLDAQRDSFRTLLTAAEHGRLDKHPKALAALEDYPLHPYLIAADLRWRLRHTKGDGLDSSVRDFIDAHPDLPPADSLRRSWLHNLAARERWDMVLTHTRPGDDTELQCLAATARIRTQAAPKDELIERNLDFWRRGRSQPDTCDAVFDWLDENGALGAEEVKTRARLAIENGNYGLARYLASELTSEDAAEIHRWLHIVRRPRELRRVDRLDPDIALVAFRRFALHDPEAAAELQPDLSERLDLDRERTDRMRLLVALLFAQDHDIRALDWFQELPEDSLDAFGRGWRIRSALFHHHWQLALDWIEALPPEEKGSEEWRYWRGRALMALDRKVEAEAILAPLAEERSYHGYLAADVLDRPYNLNRRPLEIDLAMRESLPVRYPGVDRARELHALEMLGDARKEWRAATAGMSAPELRQAALLAHEWQWHERAILTLVGADYWDDLNIRYPLPHLDAVERAAAATDLDPAYILAIIRTESLFAADARSPAGALGLMQVLPGTARLVARGRDMPQSGDLLDPAIGIRLGSYYLREMRDRFDGNLALASAAYNAGPGRVRRWLPERTMPMDLWVANIPYTETREYVQRAMSHMTVFEVRLDEPMSRLSRRLPPIANAEEIECRRQAVC